MVLTCDPEHGPDDEQTDGGDHEAADRHRNAGYAAAAALNRCRGLLLEL